MPVTKSGTATEGTDYSNGGTVSDITISAGATTGTATLTPAADTNFEGGSETAIVNITVSEVVHLKMGSITYNNYY